MTAARRVASAYGATTEFAVVDFDRDGGWEEDLAKFQPDVVVALNVDHWLEDPERFLQFLSRFAEVGRHRTRCDHHRVELVAYLGAESMIRYNAAALALKAFSLNSLTKKAYRKIGNILGERRRMTAKIDRYVQRGNLLVDLCRSYDVLDERARVLEIGTGWVNWYSVYLGLYYDTHTTMFDVWDNRQFLALKAYLQKLREQGGALDQDNGSVNSRLDKLLTMTDFEQVYEELNLEYLVSPGGTLSSFADASFDLVVSFHVMEHVRDYEEMIADIYRILRPGGFSIHQIGIDDHHAHYDKRSSMKNYLRYSQRSWKLLYENDVQYVNLVQMSDWLTLFESAGFEFKEKLTESCEIDGLNIHTRFAHYGREDLETTILTIVHQRSPA